MIRYLTVVKMAETSDFFGFVKDIASDFHIPHDAEFFEMLEQIGSSDLSGDRNGIFREFKIGRFSLNLKRPTSSMVACETVAKLKISGVFCINRNIQFINLCVNYLSIATNPKNVKLQFAEHYIFAIREVSC